MTITPPAPVSLAEVCQLPPLQRLPWVERARVFYPRWHEITGLIRRCQLQQPIAAEPPCLLLVGRTGVGKSTLLDAYARAGARAAPRASGQQPIVKATILPPATVKSMAATLLAALGDPLASHGTTDAMTRRLIHFFRACGVQMLMLDELQHFVDRDSQKILVTVSNWLKTVIKETGVACVLAGLADEAEQVVATNPQLARLFGPPVLLPAFSWNEAHPHTIAEFRALLQEIEGLLPFNATSDLAHPDLAQRCFIACDGVLGTLMALLRTASYLALSHNQERLDHALLAAAFDERLGGGWRRTPNPFTGPLPATRDASHVPSAQAQRHATHPSRAASTRKTH